MKKFKYFAVHAVQWCIALILAVLITSCFQYFYFYFGEPVITPDGVTTFKYQPNCAYHNMGEGFSNFHMDANGFNNLNSDISSLDILLMGASHIESGQMPQEENIGTLLNQGMPNLKTYNIGISGNYFFKCLGFMPEAIKTFKPRKYVIVHANTVNFAKTEIISFLNGTVNKDPVFYRPSEWVEHIKHYLYKIPTAYYVAKNIRDKYRIDVAANSPRSGSAQNKKPEYSEYEYNENLSLALKKAADLCRKNNLRLIVAYTPSVKLNLSNNEISEKMVDIIRVEDEESVLLFKTLCENNNIIFIDTFNEFKNLFYSENILPFGFINTRPAGGHLNCYGHKILSEKIISAIAKIEEK